MLSDRYANNKKSCLRLNKLQQDTKMSIDSKIENQTYKFEGNKCPFCEKDNTVLLADKDRYGIYNPTVICRECGLLFTNPRMDQESYNEFYENEYRALYEGKKYFHENLFKQQMIRGKIISDFLKRNNIIIENKYIIEIGCGVGGILYHFKDKYNAKVSGCDLTLDAVNYGKEHYDLDIRHGNIESLDNNIKPDIIIYSHVFEHILDINKELDKLKRISVENTLLYIEVPGVFNIKKVYNWDFLSYLQNAHVYHFSLKTLTNIMAKNNFKLIAGNQCINAIYSYDITSEKSFNNDFYNIITFLKQLEKWRILGYVEIAKNRCRFCVIKILEFFRIKEYIKNMLNNNI